MSKSGPWSRPCVFGGRGASRLLARGVALAAAAAAFVAAKPAHALPLLTLSGSLRGLYGSALGDPPADLNAYSLGLGLRAGVTLPASLYLGASLDWFFGEKDDGLDVSASLLQVMGNVGYDAGFGPLTLRPLLGFGLAHGMASAGDVDSTQGNFVLSPGAELSLGLGLLSVGAEARYNHIFVDGDRDALILGVGIGFSL